MKSILHDLVSKLSSMFRKKETEGITENGLGGNSKSYTKVENASFLEAYFSTFFYSLFGFIQKTCASIYGLNKLSTSNRISVNALGVLTLLLFFCTNEMNAQIVTFDFAGIAGSETSVVSNTNNAGLTTSTITRGAGLSASGNADRLNATGWAVTSIANAVTDNDYMEFTITPNANYQFSVSSIVMQIQRSGSGLTAVALRNSLDGYAANLDAQKAIVDNTSTQTITFTFSQANSASAVTYRLYGYAESGTGSGGPGDGTGNDITVNGSVTSTIAAAISTSGTLASVDTTYGVASASPTSFDVSGVGMSEGILVTPPSEYEVSLNSGLGYATSITVGAAGTIASTQVFVRLTSTANVAGSPYSGNIVLSSTGATSVNVSTVSSTVSQKSLTISGITANNKLFDGNTDATLSGTASLVGVVNSDVVTLVGTPVATFASSAAATGIAVSVTGYTISGAGSGNYSLTQPSLTADITSSPTPVISSSLTASAVYGTVASTYTITASESPTSYNSTGLPAGLTVNTSTGEITGTPSAAPGNYNVTISATNGGGTGSVILVYTITAKNLTVTGAAVTNKTYNRTAAATITGSTLVGVFGADVVTISTTGTFASATVGTGISVTSTQILGGAAAGNYTLTQPTGLTGNITPLALTITTPVAANKQFDGTTTATITGTLAGVIAPDVVTVSLTGTFASSAIGTAIAVTSTSTLSGADAANYSLTQPAGLTANITEPTLYVNTFTGASACPTNGNVPTVATNATGAALTRSTITCSSTANVFNSTTLNIAASPSNTSYIEFSATASAGYQLNVNSLSFFRQAST